MHNTAKRLLTMLLAVMMLFSLLAVSGFAANVKHFDTYTVLGDSVAAVSCGAAAVSFCAR